MTEKAVHVQTLIIGAGFSGIGTGKTLLKEGMTDFQIIEESDDFGGTWHLNRYPGCACDIPTEFYSFSDEPWKWKRLYSSWDEIHEYLVHVADKYGLRTYTRFGRHVERAYWDDDENRWHVFTAQGDHYIAQFIISGVGALNIPQIPEFEGMDRYEGIAFHSARWDSRVDLTGKRVAIIGTGASAIQIVPAIIDRIAELHLYQRTAPWVIPNFNREYSRLEQFVLNRVPGVRRSLRNSVFLMQELLGLGMTRFPGALQGLEKLGRWNIHRTIKDENLRQELTPDWTLACKRLLKSNGWYPALVNPKTELITDGVKEFTQTGIIANDGTERDVDVVIFATGFHVSDSYTFLDIKGRDGIDLVDRWNSEGMQALRGVTVTDMPNLFFLLGPNTGYGHNSVVFNIECQIRYTMQLIKAVDKRDATAVMPKRKAQNDYNEWLQKSLKGTVWDVGGCNSWYYDKNGINSVLFSDIATAYWLKTRLLKSSEYEFLRKES